MVQALTLAQLPPSVVDFSRVTRGASRPNFYSSGTGQGIAPALSAAGVEDAVADLVSLA
jgi:hypothetical protein